MKPTDFVMTAYRMAALFSSETITDDPRPTAASFHKHLARLQAEVSPHSLDSLVMEGHWLDTLSSLASVCYTKDQGITDCLKRCSLTSMFLCFRC